MTEYLTYSISDSGSTILHNPGIVYGVLCNFWGLAGYDVQLAADNSNAYLRYGNRSNHSFHNWMKLNN